MTNNYLFDLLSLSVVLLAVWCSITSWGYAIFNACKSNSQYQGQGILQVSSAGWLGLTFVMAVTQLAHLFIPISWKLSLIILLPGLCIYGLKNWSHLSQRTSTFGKIKIWVLRHPFYTLLLALGWVALLTKAMQAPGNFDSGLYHFASIRWANEYAVVPGLGNLHGRLAFNQSIFDLYALLNFFPLWNKGYALGYLLIITLSILTLYEAHLERYKGGWWAIIICGVAIASAIGPLPSPTPDPIIALLQISIFISLIAVLLAPKQNPQNTSGHMATLICLCTLICTIKLSALIFAVSCLLIALLRAYQHKTIHSQLIILSVLMCAVLGISHIGHGFITSGVPFYPSSLGIQWAPDWSIPQVKIQEELNWVYSWARSPYQDPAIVLGNWRWLKSWAIHLLPIAAWIYFGLSGILIALCLSNHKLRPTRDDHQLWLVFIPLFISVVFWFFTAPDWRFLGSVPPILLAVSGWIFLKSNSPLISKVNMKLTHPILWMMPGLILLCIKLLPLSFDGWQVIPQTKLESKQTRSGFWVLIPADGKTQCWDAPLPCTPYFNENLVIRNIGSRTTTLQQGFSQDSKPN